MQVTEADGVCRTMILAATLAAKADILMTGERTHFGHRYGKVTDGVRALTLSNSLERLLEDEQLISERHRCPRIDRRLCRTQPAPGTQRNHEVADREQRLTPTMQQVRMGQARQPEPLCRHLGGGDGHRDEDQQEPEAKDANR